MNSKSFFDQRRRLLAALASTPLALIHGRALAAKQSTASAPFTLQASAASHPLMADKPDSSLWLFNGDLPGPTLQLRQGEPFALTFVNDTDEPSAVHWHGLRIANAMDGAAGLTQDPVPPGESFEYRFTPPDAGTFWYHPHAKSWQALTRGLYGALIVDEREPPAVDGDQVLLLDDWSLDEDGTLTERFGSLHDAAHGGRLGNWLTVNGVYPLEQAVPRQARLRLRLVNTCNSRTLNLRLSTPAWLMAEDSMPLAAPERLDGELFTLAVGQRVDLMVDTTDKPFELTEDTGGGNYLAARWTPNKREGKHAGGAPVPLPTNPLPLHGSVSARHELVMSGGAMGPRMPEPILLRGEALSRQALAQAGYAWAMNGVADMPTEPWFRAQRGQTVQLSLHNNTRWQHAMHLHGHHFQVIDIDGQRPARIASRDTVLLEPQQRVELLLTADNPGRWMAHCHMLEHQLSGMMSWFEVT